MKKSAQAFITKDIERYFGFLFDGGYKIRDVQYFPESFGNWIVVLESRECAISILSDRDVVTINIAPLSFGTEDRIDLKAMVYFLSGRQRFVNPFVGNTSWGKRKQYEGLADLLNEYLDQITPYFGNDFKKFKDELISAQREYGHKLVEFYTQLSMKNKISR